MEERRNSDDEYPAVDSIRSPRILRLTGPEGRRDYARMPPPGVAERVARTAEPVQHEARWFTQARGVLTTRLDGLALPVSVHEQLAEAAGQVLDWLSTNTVASGEIAVEAERDDYDVYIRFDMPGGAGITAPQGIDVLRALGTKGSLSMNFEGGTLLTVLQYPIVAP